MIRGSRYIFETNARIVAAHGLPSSSLAPTATGLLALALVVATGAGCGRTELSIPVVDTGTPSSPAAEALPSDLAGSFEDCASPPSHVLTSADHNWTASHVCDHTLIDGPGVHEERPGGYPVAISPDSGYVLFVSEGLPVNITEPDGSRSRLSQVPALYALSLPPPAGYFGHRLMNVDVFERLSATDFAVPLASEGHWIEPRIFEYAIDIPQHPEFNGIFRIDLSAVTTETEVQRVGP